MCMYNAHYIPPGTVCLCCKNRPLEFLLPCYSTCLFLLVKDLCKPDDLKGGLQWTSTIYIKVCQLMLLFFPSEHCIGYKYILLQLLHLQMNVPFTQITAYKSAKHDVQHLHWNCSMSWFLPVNTTVLRQRVPAESLGKFRTYHYKRDFDFNSPILLPLCKEKHCWLSSIKCSAALTEERGNKRQKILWH